MNVLDDPKIQSLILRRDLSKSRIKTFRAVFKGVYELIGLTPTELIEEAKEEQIPYIKDDKIIFNAIENRKISTYFFKYYHYLRDLRRANKTISDYLGTLRTFYDEYDIELPKPIQIEVKRKIVKEGDIPTIKDIQKGVEYATSLRNRAMILFLASTGVRQGDMRNFTIGDFVEATKDYHDSPTIHELLEKKRINNIIPTWYFIPAKTKKKGNICVTFNTPECSEYIINYLRTRKNLENSDYLFDAWGHQISQAGVLDIFQRLNDKVFFRTQEGNRFFHAHALRKFFISTCNHNSSDLAKVNLLSGHSNKSSVHDTYNEVNIEVMKRFYTKLIPFLSIRDTRVHEVKDEDIVKLKEEHKKEINAINEKMEKVNERMEKYEDVIKREEEFRERLSFIHEFPKNESLKENLNYIQQKYGNIDLGNLKLIRKLIEISEEKDKGKIKQKECENEIDIMIDKIKPFNKPKDN